MRRSEIWTAAAGRGYAGKPRPVVILQDDRIDATDSVAVCLPTKTWSDSDERLSCSSGSGAEQPARPDARPKRDASAPFGKMSTHAHHHLHHLFGEVVEAGSRVVVEHVLLGHERGEVVEQRRLVVLH